MFVTTIFTIFFVIMNNTIFQFLKKQLYYQAYIKILNEKANNSFFVKILVSTWFGAITFSKFFISVWMVLILVSFPILLFFKLFAGIDILQWFDKIVFTFMLASIVWAILVPLFLFFISFLFFNFIIFFNMKKVMNLIDNNKEFFYKSFSCFLINKWYNIEWFSELLTNTNNKIKKTSFYRFSICKFFDTLSILLWILEFKSKENVSIFKRINNIEGVEKLNYLDEYIKDWYIISSQERVDIDNWIWSMFNSFLKNQRKIKNKNKELKKTKKKLMKKEEEKIKLEIENEKKKIEEQKKIEELEIFNKKSKEIKEKLYKPNPIHIKKDTEEFLKIFNNKLDFEKEKKIIEKSVKESFSIVWKNWY